MASEADGKTNAKPTELGPEVFDDFDAFMKQAIRDYYDRSWKSRRGHFVALIIASGQAMSMAADSIKDGSGLKKAALGAAGVVALRIGLRYALSGPLGIILTGAALLSLTGYVVKNQKEIREQGRRLPDADRRDAGPLRGGAGRLSRGTLRRRQPQPDGRRAAQALPRRHRRQVATPRAARRFLGA